MIKHVGMMRLSWIFWMDPKRNHQYPCKKEAEEDLTIQTYKKRAIWPGTQSLEWHSYSQRMLAAKEARNRFPPLDPPEEAHPVNTQILAQWYWFGASGFQNYERKTSLVLRHQVCGNMLQQPQKANTPITHKNMAERLKVNGWKSAH